MQFMNQTGAKKLRNTACHIEFIRWFCAYAINLTMFLFYFIKLSESRQEKTLKK